MSADRGSEEFLKLLEPSLLAELEGSDDVAYGVWPDLTLAYMNPAWFAFARVNGAPDDFDSKWRLGADILPACSVLLQNFYRALYSHVLLSPDLLLEHWYQCSTPRELREFVLTVERLGRGEGLLVRTRVAEVFNLEISLEFTLQNFIDDTGKIRQCAHCRKSQQRSPIYSWEWIPQWIARPPEQVRFLLCPLCEDKYERDMQSIIVV